MKTLAIGTLHCDVAEVVFSVLLFHGLPENFQTMVGWGLAPTD